MQRLVIIAQQISLAPPEIETCKYKLLLTFVAADSLNQNVILSKSTMKNDLPPT